MDTRIVTATGTKWDWPCLHLRADEVVTATVTWLNEAGSEIVLPATDVSAGSVAVAVRYLPGEGAASLAATLANVDVSGNSVVIADADVSALGGVYVANARFTEDSVVRFSLPFLISVSPDVFVDANVRSATIEDFRMFVYDRMASENVVEGGQEFSDKLIYDAMCQAVRVYNQVPPQVEAKNLHTFSNNIHFLEGVAGYALSSKAALLNRNRLAVPGQADAEQRGSLYTELARMYRSRYLMWVNETKRTEDTGNGWGDV